MKKYDVQNGAFGLIMNVKTGEVLAMATLGGYDPNNYLEIGDPAVQQELDRLKGAYSTLQQGSEAYDKAVNAYQEALVAARLAQWRNRVVSDGYEPGSTFKTITMAAAIEEGTTTVNDSFYCGGTEMFAERGNTPCTAGGTPATVRRPPLRRCKIPAIWPSPTSACGWEARSFTSM